jgi:hypothetical protein
LEVGQDERVNDGAYEILNVMFFETNAVNSQHHRCQMFQADADAQFDSLKKCELRNIFIIVQ